MREAGDIFPEDDGDFRFFRETEGVVPEPAFVFCPFALPSTAGGLAGDTADNHLEMAAPLSSSESCQIGPNRRRIKASFFHACDQFLDSRDFPLDVQDAASLGKSEFDAEVKSTAA